MNVAASKPHSDVHRRLRAEQGASAVEMALVAPFLIALLLGIMEFGLIFWNLSSLQTTVSAATRTAGTQARIANYQVQVKDIVEAGLRQRTTKPIALVIFRADPITGRPTNIAANTNNYTQCTANCWRYQWNATTNKFVVSAGTSWDALTQKACGPSSSTDFVGVWIEVFNKGMVNNSMKLHAVGISRLEPVPLSNGQDCQP
jgi:Flp pilus assembly protein TadG